MEKIIGVLPDNSTIRLLKSKDKKLLEEYLEPHKSETMFICSNLLSAGIEYKGKYFEGEYFGYFNEKHDNKEKLLGIIVHYWNGNIMMHASNNLVLERLTTYLKKHLNRNVAGVLGISDQACYVINELGLSDSIFSINRDEGLYDLCLSSLKTVDLPIDCNIVPAEEVPIDTLIQWMTDYEIEALGAIKNDALSGRVNNKVERIRNGDCFALLQDNVPVSLVGFNSKLKDMLQIGPVWTPIKYRNKGFARRLLASALLKEKSHGIKKAILFTDNPAAIKAYEAIGFKEIGTYRLALLKDPIALPAQKNNVEVAPYDPSWPNIFDIEAKKIKAALEGSFSSIHHVGSTSVPGLAAKPKIDIIACVNHLDFDHQGLANLNYEYRGGFNLPLRKSFTYRSPDLNVNLHIFEENDPEVELNLLFRDYLRENVQARDLYAALKYKLLEDDASHKKDGAMYRGYTLGKHDLIQDILNKSGFKRLRFVICTHGAEWSAAKQFRNKYFFEPNKIEDPYTWTFDHKDHKHFILYKGAKFVGYAHVQLWPENRAALRIIVIDEKEQGKGYGKEFMSLIEKWLQLEGYKSIHTESSPEALKFYQAIYYVKMPFDDPDGYEGSPDDIEMGKLL